jgi:hypothetical protein
MPAMKRRTDLVHARDGDAAIVDLGADALARIQHFADRSVLVSAAAIENHLVRDLDGLSLFGTEQATESRLGGIEANSQYIARIRRIGRIAPADQSHINRGNGLNAIKSKYLVEPAPWELFRGNHEISMAV